MNHSFKKTLICLFGVSLVTTQASAQLSSNPDKFLGNITTYGQVRSDFASLWNQITCENESKWDAIEPSRGNFSFSGSDRAANYAKQHSFPFKYHTLIWGGQYPGWMNNLSTSEQAKAIEEYFEMRYYGGEHDELHPYAPTRNNQRQGNTDQRVTENSNKEESGDINIDRIINNQLGYNNAITI